MDISNICRGCMNEVPPQEQENFDQRAIDMFYFCTNIAITESETLPKHFCCDCFSKIESSYSFIKEAHRVHVTLKNILSRSQTSVIVQPEPASTNITQQIPKNIIPNYYLTDFELSPDNFVEKNLADDGNAKLDTDSTGLEHYLATAETNMRLSTENPTGVEESGDNQEKYVCAICQNSFANQTSVAEHIENTHMNENKVDNLNCEDSVQRDAHNKKNQICPICRKAFTFKAWLDRHMGKEHAGQKYTCKHCTKTFPKLSKLNEHAKCHSTERLFTCGVCDARFKRQKELTAHARKHSDVRPYSCEQCGMRFKTKSTLQGHSLLHEQKKPHLCSVCGWRFAQGM
ncbi:unnamed protein product [Plutella xylostella]|uniref:(diamondback moth) hypothetical protein n=1 Tax=Plutella xylostella TaxID=51655 RepID=A0A8S4FYN0_PLUXY|nr:unnamed protein product [Plutella xylostella]